ncbi:MAG: GNAT family N-acetyltransferase [Clostridia bacterium]
MIKRIETERLILRKAEDRDLELIWNRVWRDGRLAVMMLWTPTPTRAEAEDRLARTKAFQAKYHAFFVCLRETDEPIGFVGVRELEGGVWDETGLCIAADWQGQGYGKETLRAMIGLVFRELGGRAFRASCFHENKASAALIRSCGFRYVGSHTETREHDGYEYLCDCFLLKQEDFRDEA